MAAVFSAGSSLLCPRACALHLAPPFNEEVELNEVVVTTVHELFPLLFLHLLHASTQHLSSGLPRPALSQEGCHRSELAHNSLLLLPWLLPGGPPALSPWQIGSLLVPSTYSWTLRGFPLHSEASWNPAVTSKPAPRGPWPPSLLLFLSWPARPVTHIHPRSRETPRTGLQRSCG